MLKAAVFGLFVWLVLAPGAFGQQAAEALPDMTLGKADAPVELIEYASMSCPHCADFHANVLPELKTKYIDTGKLKLVFREFPLNLPAYQASILARCAGPERFFGFIDVLFREQAKWATAGDVLGELKQLGRLGGVPAEKYDGCLNDKKLTEGILQVRFIGENTFKVQSTPSFVIGGKLYVGNHTVAGFETVIEALLKGASAPAMGAGPASTAPGGSSGIPPYLIVIVVVIVVGGVGIYLLRRQSSGTTKS